MNSDKADGAVQPAQWLALVGDAYGGRGGIAQYNRDFLDALAESARSLVVTVLPRLAPDKPNPPPGISQGPAQRGRLIYAVKAVEWALARHVDIVFCGHLFMAPLAYFVARIKRAKLIVQMHGIEAWPVPSRLQRAAVERADLILCVSRATRTKVLRWASIAPERVLVVPNTVADKFGPADGSALRASLGVAGRKVLLTVARLDSGQRYKGHERVIEAIPSLVAAGHDVFYIVAGEGDDRPRLERYASDLGVADRVAFVGAVSPEELPRLYNAADLYVMPSVGEGFGIAFIEATASGTPAIGLCVEGARDALVDGELGTAVPAEQLVPAMSQILSSPRVDQDSLARRTREKFGRPAFRAQLIQAIDRLHVA